MDGNVQRKRNVGGKKGFRMSTLTPEQSNGSCRKTHKTSFNQSWSAKKNKNKPKMFNYIKWVAVHSVLVENTTDLKNTRWPRCNHTVPKCALCLRKSGYAHAHAHALSHTHTADVHFHSTPLSHIPARISGSRWLLCPFLSYTPFPQSRWKWEKNPTKIRDRREHTQKQVILLYCTLQCNR